MNSSGIDTLQDPEYSDSEKLILEKGTCCICGQPLSSSKYVNIGMLNKKATWKYPVWGNVLIPGCQGRALFYVCDRCQESSEKGIDPGPVKYAVEVRNKEFILHRVEELEDVPPVTEADIVEG